MKKNVGSVCSFAFACFSLDRDPYIYNLELLIILRTIFQINLVYVTLRGTLRHKWAEEYLWKIQF